MKSAKFFIAFTFLLAFAFQTSAQGQASKIVWKNFQNEYKRLEHITPVIVNENEAEITFLPSWFIKDFVTARLLVFDEKEQIWISAGYYLTCGLVSKVEDQTITNISPNTGKSVRLDFGETFFNFSEKNFNSKTKFKISIEYQFKNSEKYKYLEAISPEFSITEK